MDEKTRKEVEFAKSSIDRAIAQLERQARVHPEVSGQLETVIEANLRGAAARLGALLE